MEGEKTITKITYRERAYKKNHEQKHAKFIISITMATSNKRTAKCHSRKIKHINIFLLPFLEKNITYMCFAIINILKFKIEVSELFFILKFEYRMFSLFN